MLTELNDDGNDDSTCFNQIVFVHFYKKTKRLCSSKKKEEMLNIGVEGTK